LEENLISGMSPDDIQHSASVWWHEIDISDLGTILLGSLSWPMASCGHRFNPFSEISVFNCLGLLDVYVEGWEYTQSGSSSLKVGPAMLPNGWAWYGSQIFESLTAIDKKLSVALADLPMDEECRLLKHIYPTMEAERKIRQTWLSQANRIMDQDQAALDAGRLKLIHSLP
jgi:hypothetical protein